MALSLERYAWPKPGPHLARLLKERSKIERERSALIPIQVEVCLPECLIIEILSWLPVKDLLQFKSVCKSWYAIISSRDFVSKHLNNYYNNNDTWRGCLLAHYQITNAELILCELLLDETPQVLAYDQLSTIHDTMRGSTICGPCDGLYYLFSYNNSLRALWNPAINESKPLPELVFKPDLPSDITYAPFEVFGFGLDPITKDYKVVVIKNYWRKTCDESGSFGGVDHPSSILAYSLRTDSWRYCGDLARAYNLKINECYMYVNGCCYWLGLYPNFGPEAVIISFDMATNVCEEIDVPDYAQPSSECLAIYDGSLSLLSLHDTEKVLDIWTFKEGSWTKQYTMGPLPHIWNPVGHWNDNCLLLESRDGELVLIDPSSHELKNLVGFKYYGLKCYGVFAYMESLVSFEDKTKSGLLLEDNDVEAENNQD